jgi:decaprenylphospho-beta-D-ribofuranose 2-oxidase
MKMPSGLTAETRTLSGWGRTNPVTAQVVQPSSLEQLQELIRGAPPDH